MKSIKILSILFILTFTVRYFFASDQFQKAKKESSFCEISKSNKSDSALSYYGDLENEDEIILNNSVSAKNYKIENFNSPGNYKCRNYFKQRSGRSILRSTSILVLLCVYRL